MSGPSWVPAAAAIITYACTLWQSVRVLYLHKNSAKMAEQVDGLAIVLLGLAASAGFWSVSSATRDGLFAILALGLCFIGLAVTVAVSAFKQSNNQDEPEEADSGQD